MISVIMAAYNAAATIEEAVKSVTAQTLKDWELIIADDGSTDKTFAIAAQLAAGDKRITVIKNEKNIGVSETRLKAAEESHGEWIAILDSDDAWEPDKLSKELLLAQKTGAELIYTGSAFMDETGNRQDYILHVPLEITHRELLSQNLISNSSAMVKRDLYIENYAKGDRMHEDFAVWLSILKKGHRACGIDEPLLIYRISRGSKSGKKARSAVMNWNTYRYTGLSLPQALYYEIKYALNGIKKYRKLK